MLIGPFEPGEVNLFGQHRLIEACGYSIVGLGISICLKVMSLPVIRELNTELVVLNGPLTGLDIRVGSVI